MNFITFMLALTALATAELNDTQMYKLKTVVKGDSEGKEAFNDLYLYILPSSSTVVPPTDPFPTAKAITPAPALAT